MRRVIVTCGPSYEPIDKVRRITNQSTGKLGILLSNELCRSGFDVLCLKGIGATDHNPLEPSVQRIPFSTNEGLLERLHAVPSREGVAAIFHAAALCDFRVKRLAQSSADLVETPKISSRDGEWTLVLEPAKKLIGELRALFPAARIVGWKYELAGNREDVVAKGWRQIEENRTDACVLNGSAYGRGFGILQPGESLTEFATRENLCISLIRWLSARLDSPRGSE